MKRIATVLLSMVLAFCICTTISLPIEATSLTNVNVDNSQLTIELARIKNISGSNRTLTVKIEKVATASGYQVQISTSKKFRSKYTRTTTVKGNTAKNRKVVLTKVKDKSKSVKLQNGKKYYVRVRAYNIVPNGDTTIKAYGKWSKVKMKKPKRYQKKVTVYYY